MATINKRTLEAAEVLFGVSYTAKEHALMLGNIDEQVAAAVIRRRQAFPNDLPPASRFDPRLPGFVPPAQPSTPRSESLGSEAGPLPQHADDIAYAPISHQAQWIRSGALSSRALTEIYLTRIERFGPGLDCFITVVPEVARAQAEAADENLARGEWLGPLHGIPYALKDLFDTKGIHTTWGATPYQDRLPSQDARVVELLAQAGAVLLGKTTLGALAYGDVWFGGKTRNPFNLEEGSSGSSAGSASATAAGLCGFSIGTETFGSITSPSHRCGTTGLRPTFGRVSRQGAMALCWSLDKVGPICRSVADCGLVLSVINGGDAQDRSSIDMPFGYDLGASIEGLKVGYFPAAFADESVTDTDRHALQTLHGLGPSVVPLEVPDLPYGALLSILMAEAAAAFEALTLTDRDDELVWQDAEAWPNIFRKARFLSAVDHVQADRLRYRVMEELDKVFQTVDVLIGPFSTGPMLLASNFTGHPCLHVRAGFEHLETRADASLSDAQVQRGQQGSVSDQKHRVPHGVSLWSGLFNEAPLISVGQALEKALAVAQERPVLPD